MYDANFNLHHSEVFKNTSEQTIIILIYILAKIVWHDYLMDWTQKQFCGISRISPVACKQAWRPSFFFICLFILFFHALVVIKKRF